MEECRVSADAEERARAVISAGRLWAALAGTWK